MRETVWHTTGNEQVNHAAKALSLSLSIWLSADSTDSAISACAIFKIGFVQICLLFKLKWPEWLNVCTVVN